MSHFTKLGLGLIGTFWASTAWADVPRVVTDIAPVHSLVARVMEGVGAPELLLPAGASPHSYAMRPSDARRLNDAQLFIWVGPVLTPWLEEPLETLAPQAEHISLMAEPGTTLLPLRDGAGFEGAHDHGDHGGHDDHEEEGPDDHDHDTHKEAAHADHKDHKDHDHDKHDEAAHDDHADHDHDNHEEAGHADHDGHEGHADEALLESDPHVWLDPRNAQVWLPMIAEHLSEADPDNAAAYAANAAAGQAEIAALEQELTATLAPILTRPFVVFHDAYQPFEARFGVEAVAAISPSDAQKPGAARLSEVREIIAETGATCGFAEPQMNPQLLEVVGEGRADFTVAVLDPLGVDVPLGVTQYPTLLRNLAGAMAQCLK